MKHIERRGRPITGSGFRGVVSGILVIVKAALNEFDKGGAGFLGVRTNNLELKEGSTLGAKRNQVQNALSIGDTVVPEHTNVGLKPLRDLYHLVSSSEMEPVFVGDFHSSSL